MENQSKAEVITMNAAWSKLLEGLCANDQMIEKVSGTRLADLERLQSS